MRESNHLPWMGRTVVTAIMVLVGFGLLAGAASAQTMVYDYDDAAAWWDLYECDEMRTILGEADNSAKAAESAACKMFAGLTRAQQRRIEDFIDPATAADHANIVGPHASNKVWWNMIVGATPADNKAQCARAQALTGLRAMPDATNSTPATGDATLVCRSYDGTDGLRGAEMDLVMMAGNAVSGRGMMPTDAPAVPLVGVGILGLLLAGRGAWLRRRS